MVETYAVTGMTCSACSSGIEHTLARLKGVNLVEVSLMGKSMKIDFDEGVISEEQIFAAVRELGYGVYREGEAPAPKKARPDRALFIRFIISVALLVPLMYVSMGHMFGAPLPPSLDPSVADNDRWFAIYQLVFAAAVIAVNYSYFSKGFMAAVRRVPNMDTLVALGSGVSFAYSLAITVLIFADNDVIGGAMDLHFESAAMILALVDVGKWLEEKAKHKTGDEIEKLLKLAPDDVTVERQGVMSTVPLSSVKVGDVVVVKQGEYVPVENVNFRFSDAEENTLENISFSCRRGETTAIIGSTGSGKSTIARLILRFHDVSQGRILLKGQDIRSLPQKELRQEISYVPQKAWLFSGTIEENLAQGKENAKREEMFHALETAQAGFVKNLPQGLETRVAQGGTNFSGGQKQRLCIARALMKASDLYIFDDSFSALDFKTDKALRDALQEETKEAAVLIIAQRISTILHASQIVVLDEGEIAGVGNHEYLMENCTIYRDIARSQMKGGE